ncbi:MAG TPA: glycosyltransferase [Nocardioides sp.]|nr:glycosyltransferase [Nocardioides sp.]
MPLRPTTAVRLAALGYVGIQTGKTAAALRAADRAPAATEPTPAELARVVVAQPILSGDPGLEDALRDNLLSLAGARFCWLVDTDDPEAQRVAGKLADELGRSADATTRVEVVRCDPAPDGTNPKLWKLQEALDRCTDDDVLVVLDDDTRLPAPSLGALLGGLGRATLVTGLPAYLPGTTVWARLVEQFVDNNAAVTYLPTKPVTINGMTWAMRAVDLRAIGGFTPLLRNLTDDLAVAGRVLATGGTLCQTASPQWLTTTVPTSRHYARLMHRWFLFATLLLRRQPPSQVATISTLHGTHPLLLWTVLVGSARARRPGPLLALLAVRAVLIEVVQRRVYGRSLQRPLLSVVSELAQPAHLGHGALRRTITWRTRVYRVHADDRFEAVR